MSSTRTIVPATSAPPTMARSTAAISRLCSSGNRAKTARCPLGLLISVRRIDRRMSGKLPSPTFVKTAPTSGSERRSVDSSTETNEQLEPAIYARVPVPVELWATEGLGNPKP